MLAAHVLLDVSGEVVTGNTDGVVAHDATKRYYGNLGRATTYVNNHVALGSLYVNAYTDGGSHRLEYQVYVPTVGMLGRVADSPQLNLGAARRHADNHPKGWREEAAARMYHLDKSAHHLLAGCKVGYHTVTQRTDGAYVVVRLLIHHLGLLANSNHLVCAAVKGNDRWLINNYFVVADDDGVGRSQVHRNFLDKREKSHECVFIVIDGFY